MFIAAAVELIQRENRICNLSQIDLQMTSHWNFNALLVFLMQLTAACCSFR